MAFIAVAIKLDSRGTVFFVQQRVGLYGKLFSLYKFRTMYQDVPKYQRAPASRLDKRVTRVGRILRRFSLDELPQLLNVLMGEMSLVGPRPEMPFIVALYTPLQRKRFQVLPGITGLWQVCGKRNLPIVEGIKYDLYYVKKCSFTLDLSILIRQRNRFRFTSCYSK